MNRHVDGDSASEAAIAPGAGSRAARYPWQLVVAGVAWLILGVTLVFAGTAGGSGGSAASDGQSLDQLDGLLGDSVLGSSGSPLSFGLLLLGIFAVILAGMLLLGQGWARQLLTGLGVIAVIVLALAARWESFAAMLLLVLGTVPLLAPSVHRYLTR